MIIHFDGKSKIRGVLRLSLRFSTMVFQTSVLTWQKREATINHALPPVLKNLSTRSSLHIPEPWEKEHNIDIPIRAFLSS